MSYDPSKSTWYNDQIEYLFNSEIYEYDLQDAGYSLIKEYHLLPEEDIQRLSYLEKVERIIAIGKLQRDRSGLSRQLSDLFTEIRRLFIEENNLSDDRILSVKKDAFFTIGKCSTTTFGQLTFVIKNKYSSYLRFPDISNIELYYSDQTLDIKGIGEVGQSRHRLYLLEFLKKVMKLIEAKNPTVKHYLRTFIDDYKGDRLEEGYYIEFNNRSQILDPLANYRYLLIPLIQVTVKEIEL